MVDQTTVEMPPVTPVTGPLSVEIATRREQLEAYAEEWNALLAASRANSLFLTWEWISTWLDTVWSEHLSAPDPLLCVAVRSAEGRLVALAPFYRTSLRFLRVLRCQCLRIIGDSNSGADYPDIIVHRDFEAAAIPLIADALNRCGDQWDCLWAMNMSGWTGAEERCERLCAAGRFYVYRRSRDFSAIALPESHEAYLQMLSHNRRKHVRRETKRLQEAHSVEFGRACNPDDVSRYLETLFELHGLRWSSVGQAGSFRRRPRMARFYERFAPLALKRDWLRLHVLRVDGRICAAEYGYAYAGTLYAVQGGWDPVMQGVTEVLQNMVIAASIQEGLREYDFLGDFTAYKSHWRAQERFGYDIFIGRRCLKNRFLFLRPIWPTGRYLKSDER